LYDSIGLGGTSNSTFLLYAVLLGKSDNEEQNYIVKTCNMKKKKLIKILEETPHGIIVHTTHSKFDSFLFYK
jgi:hypothetical protein